MTCGICYDKCSESICRPCNDCMYDKDFYSCNSCHTKVPVSVKRKNINKNVCRNCDMMLFKDR